MGYFATLSSFPSFFLTMIIYMCIYEDSGEIRVLVPGAGLGRLAFDIAKAGTLDFNFFFFFFCYGKERKGRQRFTVPL